MATTKVAVDNCDVVAVVNNLLAYVSCDETKSQGHDGNSFETTVQVAETSRESPSPIDNNTDTEKMVMLDSDNKKTMSCQLLATSPAQKSGNFMKGCKWSPDGLCFLACSNDNVALLVNTPLQALKQMWSEPMELSVCLSVHEPETVYDFCWWPQMSSQDPATCCFVTASKDQPMHLWDAFSGSLRASYIALNSVFEIQSAHSVCFSPDGQQILGGYRREVCLFYTDRPGSTYEKWSTRKKARRKGQNSIISCVEFNPDGTIYACGGYDKTIGFYDASNGEALEVVDAHNAGVTFIKFSADGYRLYSGARKESLVKCWDIRHMAEPLFQVNREVATNQRIYFDFIYHASESTEAHLLSGSTSGEILVWHIGDEILHAEDAPVGARSLELVHSFVAHNDCVNGCSVHPYLPIFLTASGQRHFPEPTISDDEDELFSFDSVTEENCVKLWHASFFN